MAAVGEQPEVGQQWDFIDGIYCCLLCTDDVERDTAQAFQRHWDKFHLDVDLRENEIFKQCEGCRRIFNGDDGLHRHHRKGCNGGAAVEEAPVGEGNQQDDNQGAGNEQNGIINEAINEAAASREAIIEDLLQDHDSQQTLLGMFMEGLYNVHHAWRQPLYEIISKILVDMASDHDRVTILNSIALFLLPGLLRHVCRHMSTRGRPIDFLRRVNEADSPAEEIIIEAIRAKRVDNEPDDVPQSRGAVKGLVLAAEKYGRQTRLAAANRVVQQLNRVLMGTVPAADNQLVLSAAQARTILHPLNPAVRSEELDGLPDITEDTPPGLTVTFDDVVKGIKLLSKDAAPGATGWTNHTLKFLMAHGNAEETSAMAGRIASVFNRIYSGTMPEATRWIWTRSRSLLIPKEGTNGYRPLGIGDVWYRLLMRIPYSRVAKKLGETLAPEQLAVGISGGCEIGARVVQLHIRQEQQRPEDWRLAPATINVDVGNCFNELGAALTHRGLSEHSPELVRLFLWTHTGESDLVWNTGEVVGRREIGFRQGCPGSSTNASLALLPVAARIKQALREEEERLRAQMGIDANTLKDGDLINFVDDGNILTTLGVAVRLAARIPEIYAVDALRVVTHKSSILCTRADEAVAAGEWPAGWGKESSGAKILGAPVGTDEYIAGFLDRRVAANIPPYQALGKVSKRLAMLLTTMCHNTVLDYAFRVVEPHLSRDAATVFDEQIRKSVAGIAEVDERGETFNTLLRLPVKLGGLGVSDHRTRLEAGALASRARTYAFVREHLSVLIVTAERPDVWPPIIVGSTEGQPDAQNELTAEEQEKLGDLEVPRGVIAAARKVVNNIDEKNHQQLVERLVGMGELGKRYLAFLLSCKSKAAGRWLRSFAAFDDMQRVLPDPAYKHSLRARLLEPMRDHSGRVITCCPRCWNPQSGSHEGRIIGPSHAMGCRKLHQSPRLRHDKVRDLLADVLKKHLPLQGVTVQKEAPMADVFGPGAGDSKMDITVRAADGYTRHIDIAVIEPSGFRVVEAGSWADPLTAAADREEDKRGYFRRIAPAADPSLFVPFVLESSGRPGKAAMQFLATSKLPDPVWRRLLEHISVALAHHGGKMIADLVKCGGG